MKQIDLKKHIQPLPPQEEDDPGEEFIRGHDGPDIILGGEDPDEPELHPTRPGKAA